MRRCFYLIILLLLVLSPCSRACAVSPSVVPDYITQGFTDYKLDGYEAGVRSWLVGSPYGNAVQLVARVQYFKNIERLYGRYQSYAVLSINETISSNFVYTVMVFERKKVYLGFMSQRRGGRWVLSGLRIDDQQKIASPRN